MVVDAVEDEEVCTVVFNCQVTIRMIGGGGAAQRWWDYVADNIRLGKEEEEALRHKGKTNNNNDYDGFRGGGRGGEGGGKKWKRFV
jgi:hypothetical protein